MLWRCQNSSRLRAIHSTNSSWEFDWHWFTQRCVNAFQTCDREQQRKCKKAHLWCQAHVKQQSLTVGQVLSELSELCVAQWPAGCQALTSQCVSVSLQRWCCCIQRLSEVTLFNHTLKYAKYSLLSALNFLLSQTRTHNVHVSAFLLLSSPPGPDHLKFHNPAVCMYEHALHGQA